MNLKSTFLNLLPHPNQLAMCRRCPICDETLGPDGHLAVESGKEVSPALSRSVVEPTAEACWEPAEQIGKKPMTVDEKRMKDGGVVVMTRLALLKPGPIACQDQAVLHVSHLPFPPPWVPRPGAGQGCDQGSSKLGGWLTTIQFQPSLHLTDLEAAAALQ